MVEDRVHGLCIDDECETRFKGVRFIIDFHVKAVNAAGDFMISGDLGCEGFFVNGNGEARSLG